MFNGAGEIYLIAIFCIAISPRRETLDASSPKDAGVSQVTLVFVPSLTSRFMTLRPQMRSSSGDSYADTVAHKIETLDVLGESAESRGLTGTRHGRSRRRDEDKSASRAALDDGVRLQGRFAQNLRADRRERVGDYATGRLGGDLRERVSSRALLYGEHTTQFPHRR